MGMTWVSSERIVSRKFSVAFRKLFREMENCENFVKTMSFIAATVNCSEELVEFSALIAEYFKFYYVI